MDSLDALARATAEFDRRLRTVTEDQWSWRTPCREWSVRDLTIHAIGGNRFGVMLLDGTSGYDAWHATRADEYGEDLVELFRESVAVQREAFESVPPDRLCDYPSRQITAATLLGYRVFDLSVHSWDLARAIGADESLDPELVETVHAGAGKIVTDLRSLDFFGPEQGDHLPDDAPTQHRLLALVGRRP